MFLTGGCTNMEKPLATVDHVDLPRFMGDWFVIAGIPTFVERNALAPIENYTLEPDGTKHSFLPKVKQPNLRWTAFFNRVYR